jgi:hypothetical protein
MRRAKLSVLCSAVDIIATWPGALVGPNSVAAQEAESGSVMATSSR